MLPFYFIFSNLWSNALKMLSKLKWFFLSILLVYFFFTPGFSEPFSWQYIYSALIPALFRVSVLIIILFAVNLYIQTSTKEEILSALLWILSPVSRFNINIERISLRAVLTMEYIEELNYRTSQYNALTNKISENDAKQQDQSSASKWSQYISKKKKVLFQLSTHSGIILRDIMIQADTTAGKTYTINILERPMLFEYWLPVLVILLLFLTL